MLLKNKNKKIKYLLSSIFGINTTSANNICKNIGINPALNGKSLNRKKIKNIEIFLNQNYLINDRLKIKLNNFKKRLIEIKNYRGLRNKVGLPVRGQRTHTNAKTIRKFKNTNTK